MKKTKATIILSIVLVLIAVFAVFSFTPFKINEAYDWQGTLRGIPLGIDLQGGVYAVLSPNYTEDENGNLVNSDGDIITGDDLKTFESDISGTMKILQNRLLKKGYSEAIVVKQGGSRIRVEIPGVSSEQAANIFDELCSQAQLEFKLQGSTTDEWLTIGDGLTGKYVKSAFVSSDSDGQPAVSLTFNDAGAKLFSDATSSANKGKAIGIFLDDQIISQPTINENITTGQAQISGGFDYDKANNLAIMISSGALPLTMKIDDSKEISATLGENTVSTSVLAGIIGFCLIIIFLVVFYRGLGLISAISLIVYLLLDLLFLAILPWVQLTLSGIAGVVLSIGMAVDANIIIMERIKDEYRSGKTLSLSVNNGFKAATSSIVDGNITTIIASLVLWILGAGSLKGFAITLFIGIVISMFCALIITKLMTKLFLPLTTNERFYHLKRGAK